MRRDDEALAIIASMETQLDEGRFEVPTARRMVALFKQQMEEVIHLRAANCRQLAELNIVRSGQNNML